ncbi:MAG TPA: DUF4126 domain-containing protein, partial [Actinomycetes bacterium]|nr:DUF4126 domain-containing protein [Actinomycetes bacterium]
SPEPVSNVATSLTEDISVAGVVTLAAFYPWLALAVALLLFAIGLTVVIVLARGIRTFVRRRRAPHTGDEPRPRSTAPPH